MIGCEYKNKVHYITCMEDFKEVMEPAVYEALVRAIESGIIENYREQYEDLQEEYAYLERQYDEISDVQDELQDCQLQLDDVTEKCETLQKSIQTLVNQISLGIWKKRIS